MSTIRNNQIYPQSSRYDYIPSNRKLKEKRRSRQLLGTVLLVILVLCCIAGIQLLKLYGTGHGDALDGAGFSSSFDKNSVPESLLEMAEKNPETIEFVENYASEKDKNHTIDLRNEVKKGEIPLFLQWDKRWGYEQYGDDVMGLTGCGPSCLSMVMCGLSGDTTWTPLAVARMAEENGYCVNGSGSAWTLMSEGASKLGLTVHKITFSEASIIETLKNHQPIICIMGPGDFTTTGHFIVMSGAEDDKTVQVKDPYRKKNCHAWELEKLMPQIRELWAYSY